MIAAPPHDPMLAAGHVSIAWPRGRLFSQGVDAKQWFVGFVMPRIHKARPMHDCYNPRERLKAWPLFHYKYLLYTAHNLATAVSALHKRNYVVGDISGANILVTSQALVTLIDTDSFQVHTPERVYRCRVGTPEYTPPELQGAVFSEVDRQPKHDAFGLAVLIFQLLMQGTHPFSGVYDGPGEPASIPQRIEAGHTSFFQTNTNSPYLPPPHAPQLYILPLGVQELMWRCFVEGHTKSSKRPTAREWQDVLAATAKELVTCSVNPQHKYASHMNSCPWCSLAYLQNADPFPAPSALHRGRTNIATHDVTTKQGEAIKSSVNERSNR